MQNSPQIRHTSKVNDGEPIFQEIASDLKRAGLTLTGLLRIINNDLKEKFQIESEQLKKTKQNDKDFKLNIQNLYHGTTAPLDHICDEGLDERLSRRGRFGRGIYFSDNPEKCCKYAESRMVEPYLLRCRVILGDIKEYPSGEQDETLTREPMKGVIDGKRVYYDSVKGHPRDHIEYVIYERRRVLLEYIAFYSSPRLSEKRKHSATTSDHKLDDSASSSNGASNVITPPRSNGSRSSSSSRSSSPDSSSPSPGSSPQPVPKVAPRRKRTPKTENSNPSGIGGATASETAKSGSLSKGPTVSQSALQTQKLAFQQLLQLQGNISEDNMNELIRSFTATYGSVPMQNPFDNSNDLHTDGVPQANEAVRHITHLDDDPVSEVKKKLIAEFKDFTCCNDDAVCCQYLESFDMNLEDAIHAYITNE